MRAWRGALIHGGVLVIALLWAWKTWTRPHAAPKRDSSVTLWELRVEDVGTVEYVAEKRYVKIERRKDGDAEYLWVVVEKDPRPPSAKKAPVEAEPERAKKAFVGGKSSERILEQLAKPSAVRALGKLDAERKKELGLAEPEARLIVAAGDQRRELQLGSKVYRGSERYVLDARSNEVFVLDGTKLRSLEVGESALMQRDLHVFAAEDVMAARIVAGPSSRDIVRVEGSAKASDWADAATPGEKDEATSSWMARVAQLRALEYLDDEAEIEALSTGAGAPEPVVRVELKGDGDDALGFLELFRAPGERKPDYLARTEATRVRVKVSQSQGETLEQDLANVLGD